MTSSGRLLSRPGRLLVSGIIGMALLAATVVAAVLYAVYSIDTAAVGIESARATVAYEVVTADGAQLDAALATRVGHDFGLLRARFAAAGPLNPGEVSIPVSGGQLAWTPRRLGSEMFVQLAPMRLGASGLILLLIGFVLRRFYYTARELEERRRVARDLADRDVLTGLHNRLAFEERLKTAFSGETSRLALFYLDLDDFKRINDTMGHSAGDAVIRTVASRLRLFERADDLVVRLGGDEFALITSRFTSQQDLAELAGEIQQELIAPFMLGGSEISIAASIGIAVAPDQAHSAAELVEAADKALYAAKALDGGHFAFAGDVAPTPVPRAA